MGEAAPIPRPSLYTIDQGARFTNASNLCPLERHDIRRRLNSFAPAIGGIPLRHGFVRQAPLGDLADIDVELRGSCGR
jgi:hypothetical protein